MKRNGFTLIELLAVIAILGIIFVMLMPKVLNVIDGSQKDAFVKSAQLMINAAAKYMGSEDRTIPLPAEDGLGVAVPIDVLWDDGLIKKAGKYEGSVIVVYNNEGAYEYYAFVTDGTYEVSGFKSAMLEENVDDVTTVRDYQSETYDREDYFLNRDGKLEYNQTQF